MAYKSFIPNYMLESRPIIKMNNHMMIFTLCEIIKVVQVGPA